MVFLFCFVFDFFVFVFFCFFPLSSSGCPSRLHTVVLACSQLVSVLHMLCFLQSISVMVKLVNNFFFFLHFNLFPLIKRYAKMQFKETPVF